MILYPIAAKLFHNLLKTCQIDQKKMNHPGGTDQCQWNA